MKNKNVLITGGSSGIGAATAKYLSTLGYTVILVARDKERLQSVAESIVGEVYTYCYDLMDISHMEEIFLFCKGQGLYLDGLVHCAGIAFNLPVRSIQNDKMQMVMQTSFNAFVELGKLFYNRKYSNENASIVALSSLAARTCKRGTLIYSSSKEALNTAVTIMSKEFVKRKIRVNSLMPAYVKTPMTEGLDEDAIVENEQPYGWIEPLDIAYMIEYLLSDKARFITGAHIPISAGMEF